MDSLAFVPSVRDFYRNAEICITGASGFIGKVLVERLLTACPDLKTIYIVLRERKGQPVQSRISEFSECDVRNIVIDFFLLFVASFL